MPSASTANGGTEIDVQKGPSPAVIAAAAAGLLGVLALFGARLLSSS